MGGLEERVIKGVVFDCDGTVIDSIPKLIEIAKITISNNCHETLSDEQIESLRSWDLKRIAHEHLGISLWAAMKCYHDGKRLFAKEADTIQLCKGMAGVISELSKSNYDLSILSSNDKEVIYSILKRCGIKFSRDDIYHSSLFDKPLKLWKIMKDRGYERREIVYVTDELRDVLQGRCAGINTIPKISEKSNNEEAIAKEVKSEYIAHKPEDILPIIRAIDESIKQGDSLCTFVRKPSIWTKAEGYYTAYKNLFLHVSSK